MRDFAAIAGSLLKSRQTGDQNQNEAAMRSCIAYHFPVTCIPHVPVLTFFVADCTGFQLMQTLESAVATPTLWF